MPDDPSATPIDRLVPGERATVAQIGGERAFRRRLMELGLVPGTPVEVARVLELGGVLELAVRGSRLSLRRSEAAQVEVRRAP
jgi:ferrous iron transport protein A